MSAFGRSKSLVLSYQDARSAMTLREAIAELRRAAGEQNFAFESPQMRRAIDAHPKRQQAEHPRLTMTEMYNVLSALREGRDLTDAECHINDFGLVTTLKEIYDELDQATCAAYGWSPAVTDDELLHALVRLNAERANEERAGVIRWLRPAYQNRGAARQAAFAGDAETIPANVTNGERTASPKALAEQARAVRSALAAEARVVTAAELSKRFQRAPADRVQEILETLVSLGHARAVGTNRYVA